MITEFVYPNFRYRSNDILVPTGNGKGTGNLQDAVPGSLQSHTRRKRTTQKNARLKKRLDEIAKTLDEMEEKMKDFHDSLALGLGLGHTLKDEDVRELANERGISLSKEKRKKRILGRR